MGGGGLGINEEIQKENWKAGDDPI